MYMMLISHLSDIKAQSKFPSTRKNAFTAGLGVEYLWAKADGEGKYTSNSIDGTGFSYGDLDLDSDNLGIPIFDLYFGTRMHQLHIEYMQFNLSGAENLNRNLTIDGSSFLIGDYLATDLETSWGKLYYEFFDVRQGYSYGILLGIERYAFDYEVFDSTNDRHKSFSMSTINPLIGTHVSVGQGRYALKISAFYVPKLFGILDYDTLDLSAAAVFSFGNYLQIEGGYRYVDSVIDGSDKEDYNGIKLRGLFATLRICY